LIRAHDQDGVAFRRELQFHKLGFASDFVDSFVPGEQGFALPAHEMQINGVEDYWRGGSVGSTSRQDFRSRFGARQNNDVKSVFSLSEERLEVHKEGIVETLDAELLHPVRVGRKVLPVIRGKGDVEIKVLEDGQQLEHSNRTGVLVGTENASVHDEGAFGHSALLRFGKILS